MIVLIIWTDSTPEPSHSGSPALTDDALLYRWLPSGTGSRRSRAFWNAGSTRPRNSVDFPYLIQDVGPPPSDATRVRLSPDRVGRFSSDGGCEVRNCRLSLNARSHHWAYILL